MFTVGLWLDSVGLDTHIVRTRFAYGVLVSHTTLDDHIDPIIYLDQVFVYIIVYLGLKLFVAFICVA